MDANDEFNAWNEAHGEATWNGGMRNLTEQYRIVWDASRATLLASAESSGDQMVLDLVSEAHTEMVCGEVIQSEWLESVAARIVSDAQEKERLRAELASVRHHAEDMASWLQHGRSDVHRKDVLMAYRAAHPKDAQ